MDGIAHSAAPFTPSPSRGDLRGFTKHALCRKYLSCMLAAQWIVLGWGWVSIERAAIY
jgi:hypothetical protein